MEPFGLGPSRTAKYWVFITAGEMRPYGIMITQGSNRTNGLIGTTDYK